MNDASYHESDAEDDHEEEAALIMLPPPPPPPHIKLLDRRCLDCVINYLDVESTDAMAHSCRFLRDACAAAAADPTPLMGMQQSHRHLDTESAQSSFDTFEDELSHNDSQDSGGIQAFASDNPAPSFDETDEMKSAASPSRSLDDSTEQDYDSSFGAFISDNPAPSFDEIDEMKSAADDNNLNPYRPSNDLYRNEEDPFDVIRSSVDQSTDSNSVVTPVSVTEFHDAANGAKTTKSEGREEPSKVKSPSAGNEFKPLSMNSLKSIHTPMKERRILTPERSFTPSTQNSSGSDDCEEAEGYPERKTTLENTFGSFVSDLVGDLFGSAKEVAKVLTPDSNVRRNSIDDRGPIKIGEKLYSHNEALKMWKKAKRNLEETYAEVDASGNDKFHSTTFFEKSTMYKENASRMKDKRRSRNEASTKRSTKKQGGSFTEAQERSLKKLMMKISLQEVYETVTEPVEYKSTPPNVANEEVDSDSSSNASSSCSSRSSSSSGGFSSSSATSSFERSDDYRPSLSTRSLRRLLAAPTTEDTSVATPVSSTIDSVLGSNYGVEVSSSCCRFVSGKAEPQLIKDAGGYKDVAHKPERNVSTRKPRNIAGHGMGISSSRRRNSKPVKEDKKKSSRSLKLKLIKKSKK